MGIHHKTYNLSEYIKYYLLFNQDKIYNNYNVHNTKAKLETNKLLNKFPIPRNPASYCK